MTFLSCSMICDDNIKLWPKPSDNKKYRRKFFRRFNLDDLKYRITTKYENVENLLEQVVDIFFMDLKRIIVSSGGSIDKYDNINSQLPKTDIKMSLYVTESKETLLTTETDECYRLSITSESSFFTIPSLP